MIPQAMKKIKRASTKKRAEAPKGSPDTQKVWDGSKCDYITRPISSFLMFAPVQPPTAVTVTL